MLKNASYFADDFADAEGTAKKEIEYMQRKGQHFMVQHKNPRRKSKRTRSFTPKLREAFARGGNQEYKGRLIQFDAFHSQYVISSNGVIIGHAQTISEAKRDIDAKKNPRRKHISMSGKKIKLRGKAKLYGSDRIAKGTDARKVKKFLRKKGYRINPAAPLKNHICIQEKKGPNWITMMQIKDTPALRILAKRCALTMKNRSPKKNFRVVTY